MNLRKEYMQEIMLSPTSDTTWDIAPPSQASLFNTIGSAMQEGSQDSINIRLGYSFTRKNPPGNQVVSSSIAVDVTKLPNNSTILNQLYNAANPEAACDEMMSYKFTIADLYIPLLSLYESGDPEVIDVDYLKTDVTISKSCSKKDGTSRHYWEVSQNKISIDTSNADNGIIFITVSEKITPSYLGNYSIVGFYTIIVYAIGTILRRGILVSSERIFITDMPRPDSLMLLCEGVLISRLENNIEREEELYFILIDIIRSPEIIKLITNSSIKKKND